MEGGGGGVGLGLSIVFPVMEAGTQLPEYVTSNKCDRLLAFLLGSYCFSFIFVCFNSTDFPLQTVHLCEWGNHSLSVSQVKKKMSIECHGSLQSVFQHPCFHNPGVRICWCSIMCTVINVGWILSFFIFLLSDSNLHFYHFMTLVWSGPILLLKLKWLTELAIPQVCLYHICCIGFLKVDLVRTQYRSQGLYLRDTHGMVLCGAVHTV